MQIVRRRSGECARGVISGGSRRGAARARPGRERERERVGMLPRSAVKLAVGRLTDRWLGQVVPCASERFAVCPSDTYTVVQT